MKAKRFFINLSKGVLFLGIGSVLGYLLGKGIVTAADFIGLDIKYIPWIFGAFVVLGFAILKTKTEKE